MMKHGLVSDHDDMFWISNSSMSPREKADNLLNKIIPKCGKFGYYLLYMCIRDCPGNTLGHGDARRALEDCGTSSLKCEEMLSLMSRDASIVK